VAKLPVLIAIPHAGVQIPVELKDSIQLTTAQTYEDSDPFADRIFDIGENAVEVIVAPAARTCVDVDRAPDDMPPDNPDGVIKTLTRKRKSVYLDGKQPDRNVVDSLLTSYYEPFHELIGEAVENPEIEFGLDCHTMSAYGPALSDAPGKRPLICLGNWYDQTCERATLEWLASCFSDVFGLEDNDIGVNKPFSGGYVIRTFGNNPIPWIQIMINQSLYLDRGWLSNNTPKVDEDRVEDLRLKFQEVLRLFFS
jgi:formiminoglutamase